MTRPGEYIAIIPARGGSKGLPGKNLRLLCGKPLIVHSIDAALAAPPVARIVVTSDDPAILRCAAEAGAETILRPAALASDTATTAVAVIHALEFLVSQNGKLPAGLLLLQPTSPLRTAAHITECLGAFGASDAASTISVCKVEHAHQQLLAIQDGHLVQAHPDATMDTPRQSFDTLYRPNGALYALPYSTFMTHKSFYVPPLLPYVMSAECSVDIDSALDFTIADFLMAKAAPSTSVDHRDSP